MDIIIKIPDGKLEEFKIGYLKAKPTKNGQTDLQNIRSVIKQLLIDIYISGKTQIAIEGTEIDEEIIE